MIRRPALIPFITAGDPDLAATLTFMEAMAPHADVIELGVPFSDPLADGPTIQQASARALASGTTVDGIFATVRAFKARHDTPVVLMLYYNMAYRRGVDAFVCDAASAGVDGILVVDLPLEEAGPLRDACGRHGVSTVFLAAPNTPPTRLRAIDRASTGYVYLVSKFGTTGACAELPPALASIIARVTGACASPVAVGFGISTPEQASRVIGLGADGVVVGSALVDLVSARGADATDDIASFLAACRRRIGGGDTP